MSLFFRSKTVESRSISSLPWSQGGDRPLLSDSLEGSLSLVPVYAAVRLIADSVSTLPLQSYRKTSTGRVPIPLPQVFAAPSLHGTRVDWVQRCMTSLLLRGNAYGLKVGVSTSAMPQMIEWLNPDKVAYHDGRWTYEGREVPEADLLHIPATVLPGSRLGVSPLSAARSMIESGASTQAFMRDWYRNKAVPGVVAQNTEKTLTSTEATAIKDRLRSTMRSGEPFVTGKDWSIDVMKLSADDAGFVTSSKLTATQVASLYGVPAEMIGGEAGASLTYSTLEQNQIQFVTRTLQPWLVRIETALSALMPQPQYLKFNADALIRADTKTRLEVAQISRTIGLNNIDELRAREDEAPLPDGQGQDYSPLKVAPAAAPPKETP